MNEIMIIDRFKTAKGGRLHSVVVPDICKEPLSPDLWQVGDIVSRDGTDEHEIMAFNWARDQIDVKCVKEPEPYDEESEPWTRLGEIESNLPRRYSFVRARSKA